MTVQTIIFSRDRACQLDLLLQSLRKFAPQLWPPKVLFDWSDDEAEESYEDGAFERGYRTMMAEWMERGVSFTEEHVFKQDMLGLIHPDVPLTVFFCDDDVFFRPLPKIPVIPPDHAYAPRLGLNLTHCWNAGKSQKEGELDFDCTCSVDGYFYRTEEIRERFQSYGFSNPNELETKWCEGPQYQLIYPKQSCLVNIPHNLVSTSSTNRHMGGSAAELNEKFLDGWRLDLEAMDFSDVYSVHQPIEFRWRRR